MGLAFFYMAKKYKIAVIGGGLAGLSFLRKALQSDLAQEDILLIEDSPKTKNDRTWCYWSPELLFPEIPHVAERNKVTLSASLVNTTKSLKKCKYYELNSLAFYNCIYDKIRETKNIDVVYDKVVNLSTTNGFHTITTANVTFQSDFIVNSVPKMIQKDFPVFGFNQNFYGQRIKLDKRVFSKDYVTLMDFEENLHTKVGFFYVLPYSDKEALVEYTQLSNQIEDKAYYQAKIQKYLWEKFGVKNFEVTDEEEGAIPMTNFKFSKNPTKNIFQIGIVGGDTKSTTGYTLSSVQRTCDEIIKCISTGKLTTTKYNRFKFYDRLMLYLMEYKPKLIPNILATLFQRNDGDLVLNFLDEKTSLLDEVKIFMNLPWAPFLNALKNIYLKKYEADLQIDTKSVVGGNV